MFELLARKDHRRPVVADIVFLVEYNKTGVIHQKPSLTFGNQ
jgi:hypothetical protein